MNLPWTNTHTQMFTLSSVATVAKRLGPTKIYVEDFCRRFPGQEPRAYSTFQPGTEPLTPFIPNRRFRNADWAFWL